MFTIGTFAQFAGVSIRTLRFYDEKGLIRPARIDPASGYRYYEASQLVVVNTVLVLKDLGLTLTEIAAFLESPQPPEQLTATLRRRLTEAEQAHAQEAQRLAHVNARIAFVERTMHMNTSQQDPSHVTSGLTGAVVVKSLPPVRLACADEPAEGFDADFGPIFGRLYPVVYGALATAGVTAAGPSIALYDARDDGGINVVAAVPIGPDAHLTSASVAVRELPAVARAATLIHRGPMSTISDSYATLMTWISAANEHAVGYSREFYLNMNGDPAGWITELQFVLT
jgi:DNA-binding transcriptional MerR regulator/effector-binding domain-containing protein